VGENFDVVIDMVCFRDEQATAAVAAFGGNCQHYVFCSTVCTYGTGTPPTVLIDESFPQQPISRYGRDKVACEQTFLAADRAGQFATRTGKKGPDKGLVWPLPDQSPPWVKANSRS
jgi:hypothetical protein